MPNHIIRRWQEGYDSIFQLTPSGKYHGGVEWEKNRVHLRFEWDHEVPEEERKEIKDFLLNALKNKYPE
jgi:hypothetical protein